uniref:DUF1618 domain-containing protein n=1 Tax=Leersia perrieri TaxID=77586 RepID=A0A0D9XPK7_9ORYZ
MSIPISHEDGKAEEVSTWKTDMVVPVGDRQLCSVDLYRGIILCDITCRFRLRLPSVKFDERYDDHGDNPRNCQMPSRTVCVTDGSVVRCCCGRRGATFCSHSSGAFVINAWTLQMDNMTWVMDAMVNATELWSRCLCRSPTHHSTIPHCEHG